MRIVSHYRSLGCYGISSSQKRTTNYSLYRPLVQPPYLFLNHNNGFPIRLRFSLASNHCPDLARDYSIRFSSRGYDSTQKVDRFALSFSNFSFSTVTSEYSKIRVIRDNDSASTLPFDSSLFNMDFDLPRSQDSRFQI